MRRIYCDMDMVLVKQTAPLGFDKMPWMPDGRDLWAHIAPFSPTLLTQVREEHFGRACAEKLAWINRELGANVPVIFAPDSRGKGPYARHGDILIDDGDKHCAAWTANGGVAIKHKSTAYTIATLRFLLKLPVVAQEQP